MHAITIKNLRDTQRLARALEASLPERAVIVLSGTLGAGKTRFVQEFCEAAEIDRQLVTSPTFVLCQHYEGRRLVHHVDAYRMNSVDEFIAIGGLELMQDEAVTLIEWGERLQAALPEERVELRIEIAGATSRRITIEGTGAVLEQACAAAARWFAER
jgi:tRNA threonylcarbamoyladenosine biosynthesis protein TsaE